MTSRHNPFDEHALASFLAGTLPQRERDEMTAYLASNADARELLRMAHEALEAAEHGTEPMPLAPPSRPAAADHAPRLPRAPRTRRRANAHPPRPAAVSNLRAVRRFAALAVLLVSVGLGLRLGFGPPTDALRSAQSPASTLTVQEASPLELDFSWTPVAGVDHYQVVVFDPAATQVVHRARADETSLTTDAARTLRDALTVGHVYTFRVDAYDVQNRVVQSSDAQEFVYQP